MMKRCFVCDNPARWTDAATGEPLCSNHYHPRSVRPVKRQITISDEWRRLADIGRWMAGSASESDQAMAKRVGETLRGRR